MMALPERAQIFQISSTAVGTGTGTLTATKQQQQQQTTRHALASNQIIGPLNELDQLRLSCLIKGGRPAPKAVFWRKIDLTGRTINLPPSSQQSVTLVQGISNASSSLSSTNSNKLRQTQTQAQAAASQQLEVTLNHTLTSEDLGAKFECHVEHDALESLRPTARIVSPTASRPPPPPPDAMLDLHPAAASGSSTINRHDNGGGGGELPESSADDEERQASAESVLASAQALPSLDSHVIVDLNVGVSSLDLFLTKVSAGQRQHAGHQRNQMQHAGAAQRNASEPLYEGDLIELECVAYKSKPAANITWFNGDDAIGSGGAGGGALVDDSLAATTSRSIRTQAQSAERRSLRQRRLLQRNQVQLNPDGHTYNTHSFLSIKLSRNEHRAQISCQAQNNAVAAAASSPPNKPARQPLVKSIELQVQHAPIVLMEPAVGIVVEESSLNVIDGGNQRHLAAAESQAPPVQIYCIYSANPFALLPNSVRWFKDGQPLVTSASARGTQELEVTNSQRLVESVTATGYPALSIRQVSRFDAGRYDCQLANSVGTSERLSPSEACKLEVNFRPSVQLKLLKRQQQQQQQLDTNTDEQQNLLEIDLERELALPGDEFVLSCNVLEAQPSKIDNFYWFAQTSHALPSAAENSNQKQKATTMPAQQRPALRPLGVTDGPHFKLAPMRANFTPTSYACAASNSIGQSDPSVPIDLQLSYTPGPSQVRPVTDPTLRKIILNSGSRTSAAATHSVSAGAVIDSTPAGESSDIKTLGAPIAAGRELLLECLTQDLGRPRANIWLWFKDGATIDSSSLQIQQASKLQHEDEVERIDFGNNTSDGSSNNKNLEAPNRSDFITRDNPISDRLRDLSPADSPLVEGLNGAGDRQVFGNDNVEQQQQQQQQQQRLNHLAGQHGSSQQRAARILASGRYLFIPSIQLAHRGNYSCVAVNRLGTGNSFPPTSSSPSAPATSSLASQSSRSTSNGHESYQVRVALAPSFVQQLPTRTFWKETAQGSTTATSSLLGIGKSESGGSSSSSGSPTAGVTQDSDVASSNQSNDNNEQLEMVCRVQCEPICHIEWLRNGEPIGMLLKNSNNNNNNGNMMNNYVSYHVRHTIMDENEAANMFRSIESKLVLSFHAIGSLAKMDNSSSNSGSSASTGSISSNIKKLLIDRDKLLERRHFLNNSNFTCRSSPNSMGGSVKSTTIFSVQYPPESVLISVPSDKLSLVEGSNGPQLSCEASGEPQVQYRWLLLKSGNNIITSSDLVAARYNMKHLSSSGGSSSTSLQGLLYGNNKQQMSEADGSGGSGGRLRTSRDQHNDAQDDGVASSASSGGVPSALLDASDNAQRLVELTGLSAGEQVGGTMISTLDLRGISIDRKQAGHYICEASNELGQTRQSVYVNVLYKPTCTTLHMHSLDSTSTQETLDALSASDNQRQRQQQQQHLKPMEETTESAGGIAKPFGAGANDEYAIVRETSGDFIDLRRTLVMSPLLNRLTSSQLLANSNSGGRHPNDQQPEEKLSFSGSIFSAILDSNSKRSSKLSSMNDGAALHHGDDLSKDDMSNSISSSESSPDSSSSFERDASQTSDGADSWAKFNAILLKFLNNYSKQIRHDEDRRARVASRRIQQTRRSSVSSPSSHSNGNPAGVGMDDNLEHLQASASSNLSPLDTSYAPNDETLSMLTPSSRAHHYTTNLLTFACMTSEGNPMSNLTFDWYFGSTRLPSSGEMDYDNMNSNSLSRAEDLPVDSAPEAGGQRQQQQQQQHQPQKPVIIYSNKNSTLIILMTRRLDTKTILNPFQMSLLTISVKIKDDTLPRSSRALARDHALNGGGVGGSSNNNNADLSPEENKTMFMRAPVIKSRYQSFYGPKANPAFMSELQQQQQTRQQRNSKMQFGQDLDPSNSNNNNNNNGDGIDLDPLNWQEKLGSLLSCSSSNSIGTSDASYVRVNPMRDAAGKSLLAANSNSLYEFANWRMPSLALQKSLLIISALIGCSLIVFATFALLIGPHLRAMRFLHKSGIGGGGGGSAASGSSGVSGGGSSCNSGSSSKDETGTNTGQSTSSQKSSVLGLLGNAGDCSFPSSSDDDTSARLNQLDSSLIIGSSSAAAAALGAASAHHHQNTNIVSHGIRHMLEIDNSPASAQSVNSRLTTTTAINYHNTKSNAESAGSDSINYDQPRNTISLNNGQALRSSHHLKHRPDMLAESGYENYHYLNQSGVGNMHTSRSAAHSEQLDAHHRKLSIGSTSSRILASLRLKPFSRSKITDRISDLPSITGRLMGTGGVGGGGLHNRNVSNSETATTGVSVDNENSSFFSRASVLSGRNFGAMPSNLRHSYAGGGRPQSAMMSALRSGGYTGGGLPPLSIAASKSNTSYSFSHDYAATNSRMDEATNNRLMQINSQAHLINSSNLVSRVALPSHQPPNAMDEFMRSRGLDTTMTTTTAAYDGQIIADDDNDDTLATTYGSQSIRHQSSTLYSLKNDLAQSANKHQVNNKRNKPPVFPRSTTHHPYVPTTSHTHQAQYQPSTMVYKPQPLPPPIAARALQRQLYQGQVSSTANFMPHQMPYPSSATPYSESFIMQQQQQQQQQSFVMNTDRMDPFEQGNHNVTPGYYTSQNPYHQQQQQQQHIAYANTFDIRNPYSNQAVGFYDGPRVEPTSFEQSPEHIYDLNAYATPEQTPMRQHKSRAGASAGDNDGVDGSRDNDKQEQTDTATNKSERPRVSQLIQTFDFKLPDQSP